MCNVQESFDRSWASVAVESVAVSSEEEPVEGNPMVWVYGSVWEED